MTQDAKRWSKRPEGSNWGDFGPDDQIGRLNLITPAHRIKAAEEVREGLAFCLSLPLDCPGPAQPAPLPARTDVLDARRGSGGELSLRQGLSRHEGSGQRRPRQLEPAILHPVGCAVPHGYLFDAQGDGAEEIVYYNGFRAHEHICGPFDYLHGREAKPAPMARWRWGSSGSPKPGCRPVG